MSNSANDDPLFVGELSDRELGALYRDYCAMDDPRVSAYPSEETLLQYSGWARRILAGEAGVSLRTPEEFARFCRVRRAGKSLGMGLASAVKAFRNGRDFRADVGAGTIERQATP